MEDENNIDEILGKQIALTRRKKGLSQPDVAQYLNLSTSQYGKIERGETAVKIKRLLQIAQGLNVSVEELLKPFIQQKEPLYTEEQLRTMKAKLIQAAVEIEDPRDIEMSLQFFGLPMPKKPGSS